ncbi:MAG: sodium-translocating pyrophosphatase [Candidatus Omnitrophica bacterium]|nr:sodium-translocating pyrophosphatase [Candidatus Omnitrophota bacterium]
MWIPLYSSLIALGTLVILALIVLRQDPGNRTMQDISRRIERGAMAFLRREYGTICIAALIVFTLLLFVKVQTAVAFILGSSASGLAGFIGMWMATKSNARTTQAATRSTDQALFVAFTGGSVMGMAVVGLALLGIYIVFTRLNPESLTGYALGASFIALFARVGGGIYTKSADMGADLVGKVEKDLPEDDPRNPAAIADNVGDNVGDVAGLGADILESFVGSVVAGIILMVGISMELMRIPLMIAGAGIIASIIGIFAVQVMRGISAQKQLMTGSLLATVLTAVASYFIFRNFGVEFMGFKGIYGPYIALMTGLVSGVVVGFTSEFYTSNRYAPTRKLAESCQSGAMVAVVNGLAVGMASTAIPIVTIGVSILVSYHYSGLYGVAMAALGMLAVTGFTVSMDAYGPIADNAAGISEMSKLDKEVRTRVSALDAVGNTTAAIGKGFAIGSAAFATLGLFAAYTQTARLGTIDVLNPVVIVGICIGAMLPYLISSVLFAGVSGGAYEMVKEVQRQFKERPGILKGGEEPDSDRCIDISTRAALKSMLKPGLIVVMSPVIMGFVLGSAALAGFLLGALSTGIPLALQMGNSGGSMDNAKKYIEEGHFGGKGSDAHHAAVVGDCVGDPLKDTVGPSINILLKLMSIISLVLAAHFPANGLFH